MLNLYYCLGFISAIVGSAISSSNRIVGGQNTTIEEIPHQLSVEFNGFPMCGAVILSDIYVITSGWCFDGMNASELRVRTGSSMAGEGGTLAQVKNITYHPKYEPFRVDYDVGIIELEQPLEFGPGAQPIAITGTEVPAGALVRISGWGSTQPGGFPASVLQSATVEVVERSLCQESYTDWGSITNRMVCTAAVNHVDSCLFDTGGPVTYNATLVALVSWKISGCDAGVPSVNANLADPEIRSFIRDITGI